MVNDAIENEASEQLINADRIAETGDHHGFEDPEAGGHVAENAKPHGRGIDREEGRPAEMRFRQEHVKNGSRSGDVECRHQELTRRRTAVWKAQPPFAEAYRPAIAPDIGRGHENGDDGERRAPQHEWVETDDCGDAGRDDEG